MSDLMVDGFNLAMYGMGFVFIFLILLVFLTTLMSRVLRRYAPISLLPSKPKMAARSKQAAATSGSGEQARLVAVVTAAIRRHRVNSGDD